MLFHTYSNVKSTLLLAALSLTLSLFSKSTEARERLNCSEPWESVQFYSLNAEELKTDLELKDSNSFSWWKIYENSFPKEERVDPRRVISHHSEEIGVAIEAQIAGQSVGMAYFYLLKNVPVSYLTYLAIDERMRNQQIGSQLVKCVLRETENQYRSRGVIADSIVFEIEIPSRVKDETEILSRQRRIDFYKKFDGYISMPDYFVPPIESNSEKMEMYLMRINVENKDNTKKESGLEVMKTIHQEIFPAYWRSLNHDYSVYNSYESK